MALALNCNLNLILLRQLQKSEITYHTNFTSMNLIRNGKVIVKTKKKQNLFILDLAIPNQAKSVRVMGIKKKVAQHTW